MTIEQIIAKYNGKIHNASEWWGHNAVDPREVIVELPERSVWWQFQRDMKAVLNQDVQYFADSIGSRWFLYYDV